MITGKLQTWHEIHRFGLGRHDGFVRVGINRFDIVWTFFRLAEPRRLTYADLDILFENKTSTYQF